MILKAIYLSILLALVIPSTCMAQVLKYNTHIEVSKRKKKTTRTISIQINEKDENWLSHIEIKHNGLQKFKLIKANITDLDGKILKKFKKKDITSRSILEYSTFYQDGNIKALDMYWNQYPYRVEYEYEIEEKEFFQIANWYPALYTSVPTFMSSLTIELPIGYKVNLSESDQILFTKEETEKKQILSWHHLNYVPVKKEVYSPPLAEIIPSVSVVPEQFNYGVDGSSVSWSSFGNWQTELNKNLYDLPAAEMKYVNTLKASAENKKSLIHDLYTYLQEKTKYINITIDVGGLKSYSAEYVAQNKYGDCKALTTYMKALLKQAGISSHCALIYAGGNIKKINEEFPNQQFNHVILAVPLENDTIWLENTSNVNPTGYLGMFTQNRKALIVNGINSKIVSTPALNPQDVLEIKDYVFHYLEDDICEYEFKGSTGGKSFENIMYYEKNASKEEFNAYIRKFIALPNEEASTYNVIQSEENVNQIDIVAAGRCDHQHEKVGPYKLLKFKQIHIPEIETPQNRSQSLRIDFPINKESTVKIILPSEVKSSTKLPAPFQLNSKFGSYSSVFEKTNKEIIKKEKYMLQSGEYSIEEYALFYEFIKAIKKHQNQSQILLK